MRPSALILCGLAAIPALAGCPYEFEKRGDKDDITEAYANMRRSFPSNIGAAAVSIDHNITTDPSKKGVFMVNRLAPSGLKLLEKLVATPSVEDSFALSLNGSFGAFLSTKNNMRANIWIMDMKTGALRNIMDTLIAASDSSPMNGYFRPARSTDGERLAFSSDRTSNTNNTHSEFTVRSANFTLVSVNVATGTDRKVEIGREGVKIFAQYIDHNGMIGYLLKSGSDIEDIYTTAGSFFNSSDTICYKKLYAGTQTDDLGLVYDPSEPPFLPSSDASVLEAYQPDWSPDGVASGGWIVRSTASGSFAEVIVNSTYSITNITVLNTGYPSFSDGGKKVVCRVWGADTVISGDHFKHTPTVGMTCTCDRETARYRKVPELLPVIVAARKNNLASISTA
ncbi:dipeptidyl peptidase IV/CD26 N-terminal domain-containing protein [Penicillium waksmanii]|uniref:dipeptidyl peptidase IV/CD26 N-terminal domain-containing protein n=1 Tax=Penicillium waksmanii TaxID=69791 RepID=UPI0025491866|nr:dipeptidyl peptidase IV/CD26 N-terminal domain-containing protein [Penicillium waksmanii]KAJ5982845.1 dipeptidyl peptidase IV/CD26 N-terminal domain-containing protein [Penicillium waksmanii]